MPTPPPHDALFKAGFGQPDLARSELEFVLPAAIKERLDLATLELCPGSFVDDELRLAHADLLYRARVRDGGDALVYVLFEHQSTFDARMPLRLLRYMVNVWERWEREHPKAKLPILIPVVLSHAPGGWRAAPEFASLLDAGPELLAAAGPFQPLFRFVLDDLDTVPLESLASRDQEPLTRLILLALQLARSLSRLELAASRMGAVVAEVPRDDRARHLLVLLYAYLLNHAPSDVEEGRVRAILERIAGPQGREDVMNAGEQLRAQGRAEGRAEGRVEGLRGAIGAVLSARGLAMSERGHKKLESCDDIATLTRWHARAVTAASEADVFADHDTR